MRFLARLQILDLVLRTFAGIIAVTGFPLACGYISFRGYLRMFGSVTRALLYVYAPHRWLAIEVLISLACISVYVFLKWPTKARWGLLLLCLHFVIWTWFSSMGGERSQLIYPLLGLLASLAWGAYVRRSVEKAATSRL